MSVLLGIALLLAPTGTTAGSESPQSVVFRVYRDFACEAVIGQPECKALLEQPRRVLLRYFDAHLAGLILADRARIQRTHEAGRLDFLPIWNSQDPSGTTVKSIEPTRPGIVTVTLEYRGGNIAKLTFHVRQTKNGWRISNIQAPEWSLVALLTE